eukprot:15306098-Ditylum_brightwellii.AAC.2
MKSPAAQHQLDNIEQLEPRMMEPEPIITKEEEDAWFQWESYVGVPAPKVVVSKKAGERMLVSLMIAQQIQRCESRRLLKVLFDSGGNGSMIHSRALLPNASPVVNSE